MKAFLQKTGQTWQVPGGMPFLSRISRKGNGKNAGRKRAKVTIPNLITIGRLVLVPLTIWLIVSGEHVTAFWVFVLAGVSDAVDGFLARQFKMWSDLGAYLDPIADKALLVSIFITCAVLGNIPAWLTILVVSRDVLIIGGVVLAWMLGQPVEIRPRMISKINTVAQIALVALVLADNAFPADLTGIREVLVILTGLLTVGSAGVYVNDWIKHMSGSEGAMPSAPPRREDRT
jgi:cardiolipin synthase